MAVILGIDILWTSREIPRRQKQQDSFGYKHALLRVIAWCRRTARYYMSKYWRSSMHCMASLVTSWHQELTSIVPSLWPVERESWSYSLRHNECDGVSNHQPHDCLHNRLFRRKPKKTSKLRVTGLCAGNAPVTGVFPAQRSSNAENVSIWWHHHVLICFIDGVYILSFILTQREQMIATTKNATCTIKLK